MLRRRFLQSVAGAGAAPAGVFDVRVHGAAGDGTRLDTPELQSAIDACAARGGGTVWFPAGRYRSGTLFLRSRVRLYLDAGAVLLGSTNLAHYPVTVPRFRSFTDTYTDKSLIYAEEAEDIAIEGRGAIDGQGVSFRGPYKVRPYMLRFVECRNVALSGIALRDSPMWVQHYLACEGVAIQGITVRSRVNGNNDGIDIDCCSRVRISDCDIWSGDDAVVLKSTADRVCRDVTVTGCTLSSRCNALKLGTESNGGFENIALSNCTIYDTGLAGLALEIVDGGTMDGVVVSNLTMRRVAAPVFVRLGDRARPFREGGPRPGLGRLRNVRIANIEATATRVTGCAVAGLPERPVEDVAIENVRLEFPGGGKAADAARLIPEQRDAYPEYSMFGTLPAYGLYCRHARGLRVRNVSLSFAAPDGRPALVCDDVDDLELAGFRGQAPAGPAVRLVDVRRGFVHGCRALPGSAAWLEVAGLRTRGIVTASNDTTAVERAVAVADGVPAGEVR